MNRKIRALGVTLIAMGAVSITTNCTSTKTRDAVAQATGENVRNPAASPDAKLVRSDYKPGEVTSLCDTAIRDALAEVDKMVALPAKERTIETTLLAYDRIMADFSDKASPLTFMGYVSTDKEVSAEGSACEAKIGQFGVDLTTRRDIYEAVKTGKARNAAEARLLSETLEGFERSGLKLNDKKLAAYKSILGEIKKREAKFAANLNADATQVEFTAEELSGATPDFLGRLKKAPNGAYIVTTKSTDYDDVMNNVSNAETRRKMLFTFMNRGPSENTKLIQETIALRAQAAQILGFKTWVDYQAQPRMVKSGAAITKFLSEIRSKLAKKNQADFAQLLKFKKELDPKATKLDMWDNKYLSYQLKKRDYSVDVEKIREFFPSEVVIDGLFKVYSQLLGVTYHEVKNASVWSPDVKLYEIRNAKDDRRIGYFYTDFIPRPGKYGHAAAFPLTSGRMIGQHYSEPVAAIVANFAPPSEGKPSLLPHEDVDTLFHEFGHIMHMTLTRAPYASLSGASVAQDFVEAPSQMLENWVWSPEVIEQLSGHYLNHSQKLPKNMLDKMIAARDFGQGMFYTRQLYLGFFDLKIHSIGKGAKIADITKTHDLVYREVTGQDFVPGGHMPQSFGHLMGGYDAGYYGYLWSKVYAQDMFSVFAAKGLLNPEIGARYRTTILEKGNMKEAGTLLKDFLGRPPSSKPFFKELGI